MINLQEMTLDQLKVFAYDQGSSLNQAKYWMDRANDEISKRMQKAAKPGMVPVVKKSSKAEEK